MADMTSALMMWTIGASWICIAFQHRSKWIGYAGVILAVLGLCICAVRIWSDFRILAPIDRDLMYLFEASGIALAAVSGWFYYRRVISRHKGGGTEATS